MVVPNKLIKSAVDRNRTKRQIRAVFDELIHSLVPGYDIVALAQPGVQAADYATIQKDLTAALTKIHFFRDTL